MSGPLHVAVKYQCGLRYGAGVLANGAAAPRRGHGVEVEANAKSSRYLPEAETLYLRHQLTIICSTGGGEAN